MDEIYSHLIEVVGEISGYLNLYKEVLFMMNNQLPWEKPRIKRILELFQGSKVFNIKKISSVREVFKDEVQR